MLNFLHISDTHISNDPDYHLPDTPPTVPHPKRGVEALLAAIQQLPFRFDFILHTGDVCADPNKEDYHGARELLLRFPAPLYLLPGNHDSAEFMTDILHDGRHLNVLRDAHLQLSGYHLVTLDSCGGGDARAPVLREEQLSWFADRLKAIGEQPKLVAMHHSPIQTGVPWLDDEMRIQNGDRIQRLLSQHSENLFGVFHGHIHQPTHTFSEGVSYISCPSTWTNLSGYPGMQEGIADPATPGGFNLVMLRENRTFVRRYNLPVLAR